MPNIQHSALTGAELHEPKGASGASVNTTYVSDGAGSGSWSEPEPKGVVAAAADKVYISDGAGSGSQTTLVTAVPLMLTAVIADVSTAETIYIAMPYAGTITQVVSVLEATIGTADATVLARNSAAASMGGLTVAYTGSAAGDVDTLVPASDNIVTAGDYITIETNGASTGTARLFITVVLERS